MYQPKEKRKKKLTNKTVTSLSRALSLLHTHTVRQDYMGWKGEVKKSKRFGFLGSWLYWLSSMSLWWVMSHVRRHMTHTYVWHDSLIRVTWLVCHLPWCLSVMSHASYDTSHDSSTRVAWLIHIYDITNCSLALMSLRWVMPHMTRHMTHS